MSRIYGPMKCVVYCHTNTKNGKKYVGWTSSTMEQRWKNHLNDVRKGSKTYFHNAIRKYGIEVWEHKILEIVESVEEAQAAEVRWILELKSHTYRRDGWGYNETKGGDGVAGVPWTAEMKEAQSERQLKRFESEEERKKSSERAKKVWSSVELRQRQREHRLGKPLSLEHRAELSKAIWRRKEKYGKRVFSEQAKKNISKGCKGRIVSEETKMKISKSLKGNIHTKGMKLKPRTAEQCKHYSEGASRGWVKRKELYGEGGGNLRGSKQNNAKLTEDEVREIRRLSNEGMRQRDIMIKMGISRSLVCMIVHNKLWKHLV